VLDEFSREGSSLTNIVYWGGYTGRKAGLQGGAWMMLRNPASGTIIEANENLRIAQTFLDNGDTVPIPADLAQDSTVSLSTQPFRAVKFALLPSFKPLENLTLGVRVDYIRFLTPDARTNAQEEITDPAMRPRQTEAAHVTQAWYSQSLWDREAVNTLVLSPVVAVDFKEYGSISATYSVGMYDREIQRHGVIGSVHQNFTLGATINLLVKKSQSGAVSTTCAPGQSLVPQKTCPVMGGAIDRKLYVDDKGRRIYVCCPSCLEAVKLDPEKYIGILRDRGESVEIATPIQTQ
jgi:hypothetical protein